MLLFQFGTKAYALPSLIVQLNPWPVMRFARLFSCYGRRLTVVAIVAFLADTADAQRALADVEAAARRLASTCGVDAGEVGG